MALIRTSKDVGKQRRADIMRHAQERGIDPQEFHQTYLHMTLEDVRFRYDLHSNYDVYTLLDEWELPYKSGQKSSHATGYHIRTTTRSERTRYEFEEHVEETFRDLNIPDLTFSDESLQLLAKRLVPILGPALYEYCSQRMREDLKVAFELAFEG